LITIISGGGIKKGIAEIGQAFEGMGDRIATGVKETLRLQQAQRDLDEQMRGVKITQALLNNAMAENLLRSRDLTLSEEERIEAVRTAQAQQILINEQNVAFAEKELELLVENNRLLEINGQLTDDQRDAQIDAQIKVFQAQKEAADKLRELQNRENEHEARIAAERKKRHDEWLKREAEKAEERRKATNEQADQINHLTMLTLENNEIERKDTKATLDFTLKETELTGEQLAAFNEDRRKREKAANIANFQEVSKANLSAALELDTALADLGIEGGALSKALALTNAIIASKEAIVSAASVKPFFPLGLIAVATATAIGVSQVRAITRTPEVTKKARGGLVEGPSHAQGGVLFGVGRGGHHAELEGGEAVINKYNTKKFRPLLSKINSHGGKGVAFGYGGLVPKFQTGGVAETQLATLGSSIEDAVQSAPPVLILEDLDQAITNIQAVEDISSAGQAD
jgi:hypothetical protein